MVNSALPKPGPQPELFEEGAKDEGGGQKFRSGLWRQNICFALRWLRPWFILPNLGGYFRWALPPCRSLVTTLTPSFFIQLSHCLYGRQGTIEGACTVEKQLGLRV